jgi:hypothetical protein
MITILHNLLFAITLPIDFIIESAVLGMSNYLFVGVIIATIGYSEYLLARSILGKKNLAQVKKVLAYMNKFMPNRRSDRINKKNVIIREAQTWTL